MLVHSDANVDKFILTVPALMVLMRFKEHILIV
jgi:hypothetical protein